MERKSNYAFERNDRAKAKAARREAKRHAKLAAKSRTTDAEMPDGDTGQAAERREDDARSRFA